MNQKSKHFKDSVQEVGFRMGSRLFPVQILMKSIFKGNVSYRKPRNCVEGFRVLSGVEHRKAGVKVDKPNLTADDEEETDKTEGRENRKTEKKRRATVNIVTPHLDEHRRKELQTVVGLHLGPSTIYWSKINRNGNVLDWSHREFIPLTEMSRKMQLPKLYEEMYKLQEYLPFGDIYVFEGINQAQPSSLQSANPAASAAAILRSQIISMLLTLLNTRIESDAENSDSQMDSSDEWEYFHKVYFLRPRLMSRLFQLLIGTERVSALDLVDSILDEANYSKKLNIFDIMHESKVTHETSKKNNIQSLLSNSRSPPIFTPVFVPSPLKESYRYLKAVEKEGMCQALLIGMTFYDLVVFKDPKVLAQLQK